MSAYKSYLLSLCLILFGAAAKAETVFNTISVGYFQWQERIELTSTTDRTVAMAQFFGNSFSYERESYDTYWGKSFQVEGFVGQANGGQNGTTPAYVKTYQSFFGGALTYKWAYRPSGYIALLAGPFVMYRGIQWPELSGVTAKSGSDVNGGVVFEAKVRPVQKVEIYQKIGFLGVKATYFFTLGLGLKF